MPRVRRVCGCRRRWRSRRLGRGNSLRRGRSNIQLWHAYRQCWRCGDNRMDSHYRRRAWRGGSGPILFDHDRFLRRLGRFCRGGRIVTHVDGDQPRRSGRKGLHRREREEKARTHQPIDRCRSDQRQNPVPMCRLISAAIGWGCISRNGPGIHHARAIQNIRGSLSIHRSADRDSHKVRGIPLMT